MNSGLKLRLDARAAARDVRGHDQHGVLERHRAALAVGQAAVVHHLQQRVEHVRVGLLDLVEQHDRVGPAAHRLGQLAALLVADVAGRRADQPRDRVLLHVLGHVDPDHRVLGVEHELGERPRQLGLADAGRAEEQERADRPVGVLEPGARAPQRRRHRLDRLVLADHPPVQALLHVHELLDLALHQARDRDAGPLGDDLGDVLGVDHVLEELRRSAASASSASADSAASQLLLELGDRAVLELGRAAEIGLALGALELGLAPARASPGARRRRRRSPSRAATRRASRPSARAPRRACARAARAARPCRGRRRRPATAARSRAA